MATEVPSELTDQIDDGELQAQIQALQAFESKKLKVRRHEKKKFSKDSQDNRGRYTNLSSTDDELPDLDRKKFRLSKSERSRHVPHGHKHRRIRQHKEYAKGPTRSNTTATANFSMKSTAARKYLSAQATTHVVDETFKPAHTRNKLKLKRPKTHTVQAAQANVSHPPRARERTSLEDFQVGPPGMPATPENADEDKEEKVSCTVGENPHLI